MVAYSGHGADGGYLVGADGVGISIDDLKNKLSLHTGVKEVIIDACYSGDFIGRSMQTRAIRDPQEAFNNNVISAFKPMENTRSFSEDGYYVITACSGDQLSYEMAFDIPNSPFARDNLASTEIEGKDYYILGYFNVSFHQGFGLYNDTAFSDLWADADSNYIITWNEIYEYAAANTNDKQQAQAYPLSSSHELYNDSANAPKQLASETYTVDQEQAIVSGVHDETSVEDFKSNFTNDASLIKVYNKDGQEITTGNVGTGMTVKLIIEGTVQDELQICVLGDVSGDGVIDITDILYVRAHIIGTYQLSNVEEIAAELNKDEVVDITDILYIRAHIIGTYDIHMN